MSTKGHIEHAEGITTGQIVVADVDELQYCVDPWLLHMSQQSCGKLEAFFTVVQVRGILLTRERWSHRVAAAGATPPGYVAFAGSCGQSAFTWCGQQIAQNGLACAINSTEVEFVTSDQEDHWVMLLPVELIETQTGPEVASDLLHAAGLRTSEPQHTARLAKLVVQVIDLLHADQNQAADSVFLDLLETRLVRTAIACLLSEQGAAECQAQARQRFLAFRKAFALMEAEQGAVTIQDLVDEAGVSRRSIELAFREAMGIPPIRFARNLRLNGVHKDLLRASPQSMSVTEVMENWGFAELGRAAGYYRQLFGETPSTTLGRNGSPHGDRLVDALRMVERRSDI